MGGRGVIGTVGRVVTLDNSARPSTEGGGAPSGGEGRKGRTRGDRRGEVCSCDWLSGTQLVLCLSPESNPPPPKCSPLKQVLAQFIQGKRYLLSPDYMQTAMSGGGDRQCACPLWAQIPGRARNSRGWLGRGCSAVQAVY